MFINLTPHEVKIIQKDRVICIPPSGIVARCKQEERPVGEVEGVRVVKLSMGELVNLPPERAGVIYIVSHIVLQQAMQRQDLLKPGELVRNEAGEIIGCQSLCRL